MESQKVRIIDKNGNPRKVMPHIAKDKKLMKNYGYTVQDLNERVEITAGVVNASAVIIKEENELDLLEVPQSGEKPKRKRKPNVKK